MAPSDERIRGQMFKRVIQKAMHAVGLHVGCHPPVNSLADHIKTVLHELAIDCVLDVGAHEGEYAGFLRDLDYTGEIISFEPVQSTFETLSKARNSDKHWHGQNVALGAEEGELELNIYSGSVFNSFRKPAEDGTTRFRDDTQLVRVEKVHVRRLETVLDEILAARPKANIFLKMDTQGYGLQLLRGGGRRLESICALQTGIAARWTHAGMPTLSESLSELDRLGFELTGAFPAARELDHLRVIEFDCVMCCKLKA